MREENISLQSAGSRRPLSHPAPRGRVAGEGPGLPCRALDPELRPGLHGGGCSARTACVLSVRRVLSRDFWAEALGDTGRWHLPASPRTTVLRCQWGSSSFVKRGGLILQMNADGLVPTTSWDVSLVSHESLEELRLGSPEGELFSATLAGTWAVSVEGSEVDCCKRHQPPHCPEM